MREERAVLAIWTDIAAGLEDDFEDWYLREHFPERLAVPGFRYARRYRAIIGAPHYFIYYDLDSIKVVESPDYLERLNNPTPWTRRVMPGFRNTTRSAMWVMADLGSLPGEGLLTLRLTPSEESRINLDEYLRHSGFSMLRAGAGVVRVQHWRAAPVIASFTSEAGLRARPDELCEEAVLVEGNGPSELDTLGRELTAALLPFQRPDANPMVAAVYSLISSLEGASARSGSC